MKLTIQDGRDSFYTFDSNRILLLTATDEEQIKQVEFSTEEAGGTETWTKDVLEQEDGVKYVQVPNEFLNGDYTRLVCYAVALDSKGEFTRQKEVFRIKYRPQPEDWFLTYSERVTFASIKALTEQYKASALGSMNAAKTSETNAKDSADLSRRYAEEAEDIEVETGKYSSKHWSIKTQKKFDEVKEYVGSSSKPTSALGSIETARVQAINDVGTKKDNSIAEIDTHVTEVAVPAIDEYVDKTANPEVLRYGKEQVDSYINGTSKPELDRYVNSDKKTALDQYTENEKKQVLDQYTEKKKGELDSYTNTDKKKVLDDYVNNVKKIELNTYTNEKKSELDVYKTTKADELNEHTVSLKGSLDGYTTAKEQEILEFTEQKKQEVQGVYQSDLNELKGDLVELENEMFTEFSNVTGYVSLAYTFVAGTEYVVELLSGSARMFTRATADGENIDTIFGTAPRDYAIVKFTPTANANYLRVATDSVSNIKISISNKFYMSNRNELEGIHHNTESVILSGSSYCSVLCDIKNTKKYRVVLKSGTVEGIYTRATSEGNNIDTVCSSHATAPTYFEFTATADAKYLRILWSVDGNLEVYEVDSLYGIVKDNYQSILDISSTKKYTISEFTANTVYNVPDIGQTLNTTPSNSGVGNYSICIPISKGNCFYHKGRTRYRGNCLAVLNENKVVVQKINDCSDGAFGYVNEDGYLCVSTHPNYYGELSISHTDVSHFTNGFCTDIYAPYPQLPADNSEEADFDSDSITSTDIYNYLDALSSKYPVFTGETLGNDATDMYPIKRYVYSGCADAERLGTIYIGANEHGPVSDPRECAIITARFAKDLCKGHAKDNKFLGIIKKYFRVVMIPVQNPYGFNNSTRNNGNNVNINRNYNTIGWSMQEDADKGAYAGSEVETQYIMQTLSTYNVDIALDLHCLGHVNQLNDNNCHYAGHIDSQLKIEKIIDSMRRDYGLTCSSYGTGDYTTGATGDAYFNAQGIKGLLLEFQAQDGATGATGTALHTANIEEANYTFMLRILNMLISDYDSRFDFSKFN